MTDKFDPPISQKFEAECASYAEEAAELAADGPSIEALVAAILDKKHTLSAEDLDVFEGLLNDPKHDPDERQEVLAMIWNIVVSIIDYQWDNALTRAASSLEPNSCGSKENPVDEFASSEGNMVQSGDEELSQTHNKAAGELPDQEDGP